MFSFIYSLTEVGALFTSDITCFIDLNSQDNYFDQSLRRFFRVLEESKSKMFHSETIISYSQPGFTYSKSTIGTAEQYAKSVQS